MEKNEEWNNFMHKVTEVTSLVKDLTGSDKEKASRAQQRADEYLDGTLGIEEDMEVKVKTNRTVVNKKAFKSMEKGDENAMSSEAFMAEVSRDAAQRYEEKRIRRERANTFKTQATKAFRRGEYERALACYNKAIEQIKDDCLLYTDRALTLIKLGKYEKVLPDCEWASRINENSFKALLYKTKAHKELDDVKNFEEHKKILFEKFEQHRELIEYFLEKTYDEQEYS